MAISNLVATNVVNFIDYSLVIVVIMTIWYGVKFFMVDRQGTETHDQAQQARQDAARDLFGRGREHLRERAEEQRQQQEARRGVQERRRWLGRAVGRLARMIENTDKARASLGTRNARNLTEANSRIRDITADLKIVSNIITAAQRNLRGEKRTKLGKWYADVELMEELLRDEIIARMPPDANNDAVWRAQVPPVRGHLNVFKTRCGVVMDALQDFIDTDNLGDAPGWGGARRPVRPTPTATPSP